MPDPGGSASALCSSLADELAAFDEFGTRTTVGVTEVYGPSGRVSVDTFTNEFWTSKQRAAHRLHEISYRACFKPQLPRFFIDRLTGAGDVVYDPFMGRGTTLLEAALAGRVPAGCDVNPLSAILVRPRLEPPVLADVETRLGEIDLAASPGPGAADVTHDELRVFYHPDTLRELTALRAYLLERAAAGTLDAVDRWIRMVAVNRLTGHSSGFFSVYTLPPNQAVSVGSQRKINERRSQIPPRRHVPELILKKSGVLLGGLSDEEKVVLASVWERSLLVTGAAAATPEVADGSVALVVTSPPFLDVVDYAHDNWLRCWFCGIRAGEVPVTVVHEVSAWQEAMTGVFLELSRVLQPGGHVAFEVGEVRAGTLKLEEAVLPCGLCAGLFPALVLINDQDFTKTANCWGVSNRTKGTNTNRVVLFQKR
ncbi:MAG: DNA methyltransferase [Candidatus Eisenbacteria bacterium]